MAKSKKEIEFKKRLQALPKAHQDAVLEEISQNPNIKIGFQKSLQLGINDLPLFSGIEEKQPKLF